MLLILPDLNKCYYLSRIIFGIIFSEDKGYLDSTDWINATLKKNLQSYIYTYVCIHFFPKHSDCPEQCLVDLVLHFAFSLKKDIILFIHIGSLDY